MNLADSLYKSFIEGKTDPVEFVILCLKGNNTRLSKFLVKEFKRKKIRINLNKLKDNHKVAFAYGKRTEWWLILRDEFKDKELSECLKSKPVEIDYVLPIASGKLAIVAIKK